MMPRSRTLSPADLFFESTPDTARETSERLAALLLDPRMPEEMRREVRDYLSDLTRAFPEQVLTAPDADSQHEDFAGGTKS